jgi:hypothetical protein
MPKNTRERFWGRSAPCFQIEKRIGGNSIRCAEEHSASSNRISIRKQESECETLSLNQSEDRTAKPGLSDILGSNTPRGHGMKYVFALLIFSCGIGSSCAAASLDRVQLAQIRTSAEYISNCNSANFSCSQSCGLSGSCVAKCTAEAASCKARCSELK